MGQPDNAGPPVMFSVDGAAESGEVSWCGESKVISLTLPVIRNRCGADVHVQCWGRSTFSYQKRTRMQGFDKKIRWCYPGLQRRDGATPNPSRTLPVPADASWTPNIFDASPPLKMSMNRCPCVLGTVWCWRAGIRTPSSDRRSASWSSPCRTSSTRCSARFGRGTPPTTSTTWSTRRRPAPNSRSQNMQWRRVEVRPSSRPTQYCTVSTSNIAPRRPRISCYRRFMALYWTTR